MAEDFVETHDQRQEVVAGQLRAVAQVLQQVLERVRAGLDGGQAERRGVALDAVHLAENLVDLGAEIAIAARRDLAGRC